MLADLVVACVGCRLSSTVYVFRRNVCMCYFQVCAPVLVLHGEGGVYAVFVHFSICVISVNLSSCSSSIISAVDFKLHTWNISHSLRVITSSLSSSYSSSSSSLSSSSDSSSSVITTGSVSWSLGRYLFLLFLRVVHLIRSDVCLL